MKNNFSISSEDFGKRLDKFLVEQFPEVSRTQIQKLIEGEKILVNEKKVAKHYFLEKGDEVNFMVDIDESVGTRHVASLQVEPNSSVPFSVLFESHHYIIVEKPSGVVVHQAPTHPEPDTLVNGLVAKYPEIVSVGVEPVRPTQNFRPGIVHRLDKDVSGIMVVARTNEMFLHLKKQFEERLVKKIYIALVHGKIEKEEDEICFDIGRSKQDKRKMAGRPPLASPPLKGGDRVGVAREAITYFEVLKHFERYTLLKVQIKTGRTHQIRVHLNAYTHPVVGDNVYRPKSLKTSVNLGRLFLHAHELGFYGLEGNWMEYKSELPKELSEFLQTLS